MLELLLLRQRVCFILPNKHLLGQKRRCSKQGFQFVKIMCCEHEGFVES